MSDVLNTSSLAKNLDKLNSVPRFLPTVELKRAKSRFWLRYVEEGGQYGDLVQLATAMRLASSEQLSRNWDVPGFYEWFVDGHEYQAHLEYLAKEALMALESVITDEDSPANARVSAAKLVLEAANRMPKNDKADKYRDEQISEMTKAQLEEFITKNVTRLKPDSSTKE